MKSGEIYIKNTQIVAIKLIEYLGKDNWSISMHYDNKPITDFTIIKNLKGFGGFISGKEIFKYYTKV